MEKTEDIITTMMTKGIARGKCEINRDGECHVLFDMSAARQETLRLCHEAGLDGPDLVRTVDRLLERYIDRELRPFPTSSSRG